MSTGNPFRRLPPAVVAHLQRQVPLPRDFVRVVEQRLTAAMPEAAVVRVRSGRKLAALAEDLGVTVDDLRSRDMREELGRERVNRAARHVQKRYG